MKKFSLDIIGTHLDILFQEEGLSDEGYSSLQAELLSFETRFSRFIRGNWLSRLNQEREAELDEDGLAMLSYMLSLAEKTDGYFDPTVGKRLRELGYGLRGDPGESHGGDSPKYDTGSMSGYKNIEIIDHKVILHDDIELEFGGVGKGYLIDSIAGKIRPLGEGFLINFGGDFYGYGTWKIGLESPFASDEVIGTHILSDDFLACSAGTKRKWGNHHHLIDPHTGESAHEVVASYIEVDGSIVHGGMIADSYATTLCVMPWDIACRTLADTEEVEGVLVRHDGAIFQSKKSKSTLFS